MMDPGDSLDIETFFGIDLSFKSETSSFYVGKKILVPVPWEIEKIWGYFYQ